MKATSNGYFLTSVTAGVLCCCALALLSFPGCKDSTHFKKRDVQVEIDSLIERASEASRGNARQALELIDHNLPNKKLTPIEQFKVYAFKSGLYFVHLNDAEHTNIYADSMLAIIEANNPEEHQAEYALANYSKGDALFKMRRYSEAYTYYYKARLISKNTFDSCTLSEYNYRIAMVLYRQDRFREAAAGFQDAFSHSATCPLAFSRYYRMQEILNNTGLSFYKCNMNDSALFYFNRALEFIQQYASTFEDKAAAQASAKAVVYGNMAQIYEEQGNYSEARNLLLKSIDVNGQKGFDNRDAALSELKLAGLYYKVHKIDSMKQQLDIVRSWLDTVPNNQVEMEWNRQMWKYYDSKQLPQQAYQYLVAFTAQNDSLQVVNKGLNYVDAGQQIKMLEKQHVIDTLRKDNDIKQMYLYIAIVFSTLVILIILLVWNNFKRSKRNVQLLTALNNQVNEQKIQLENTLQQLEYNGQEKDRILRVVAHDLRTPIASISMLSNIVQETDDIHARKEMMQLIKTACDNSLNLISEILEAAGFVDSTALQKEKIEVNKLVNECVELLRFKASEKDQQIQTVLLQEQQYIIVNKEKIWRVLGNLITNAIKFSDKGATITLKAERLQGVIRLSIHDAGIGIPQSLQDKVFDMFTQAKRAGTFGEKPFGLGLSISRQIIEAHEGHIWFESQEGVGTTFYVELPVAG